MSTPHTPPPGLAELQDSQTERDIEVTRRRRAKTWQRILIIAGIAWALAASTVLIYMMFSVRHTQIDGTPNGKKLVRASEQILSCTTTTGECTRANQEKLAGLVNDLVASGRQGAADAAACGAQPQIQAVRDLDQRAVAIYMCMGKLQQARNAK